MTTGILLDTHVPLWLEAQLPIRPAAQLEIARATLTRRLFVSDISLWEFGVAIHKKNLERRPDLDGLSIDAWFRNVTRRFGIRAMNISRAIALEAAEVPGIYGSGDPGDCFLIATAHVRKLALVTRDAKMIKMSERHPDYLNVIPC